jgi:saccharopine dehydrogenase-like NADP-dependent oxidoreductase
MQYRPGEQDLVHLEHRALAVFPDGHSEEIQSRLILAGEPFGDSAMATTVSTPAAIATRLILEGRLDATGIQIPTAPEFYRAILPELEGLGIRFEEQLIPRHSGPLDPTPPA